MEKGNDNHYVYILECKDGTYYTGYTNNIEKRLEKHEKGVGAKYTRGRAPFKLVYEESYLTKSKALKEEYRIKKLGREKKEKLFNRRRDNK